MTGAEASEALVSLAAVLRLRAHIRPEEAVGALALALGVPWGAPTVKRAARDPLAPKRTSADRMRVLRAKRRLELLGDAESDAQSDGQCDAESDAESDAGPVTSIDGGLVGGPVPVEKQGEKSGKETGSTGTNLEGSNGGDPDVTRDGDAESDARGDASQGVTDRVFAMRVFDAWKQDTGHHRAILDRKREKRILARRREGFTIERLVLAITNRRNDRWLMGLDDSPRVYDDLETLLRDAAQVERLERLTEPMKPRVVTGARGNATPMQPSHGATGFEGANIIYPEAQ